MENNYKHCSISRLMKALFLLAVFFSSPVFGQQTDSVSISESQFYDFVSGFEYLELPLELDFLERGVAIDSLEKISTEYADSIVLQNYATKSAQQQRTYYYGGRLRSPSSCVTVLYYVMDESSYPMARLSMYNSAGRLKEDIEVGFFGFFRTGGEMYTKSMITEGMDQRVFILVWKAGGQVFLDGTGTNYNQSTLYDLGYDCTINTLYDRR